MQKHAILTQQQDQFSGHILNILCNCNRKQRIVNQFGNNWYFILQCPSCHVWLIHKYWCFWTGCVLYNYQINISLVMQGIVATGFAFGGQCNKEFVENLNLNATVKDLWKSITILSKLWAEMRTSLYWLTVYVLRPE